MPFCSQCGNQVGETDRFCSRCAARQGGTGAPPPPRPGMRPTPPSDPLAAMDDRTVSILCYVPGIGWIMSIIVLASERFRKERLVRFHGFQSLYLFVGYLIEEQVLRPMLRHASMNPLHAVLRVVLLVASIFMMVKASHRVPYSLPLFGELAQKSMSEE